jgi:hypothetical protein
VKKGLTFALAIAGLAAISAGPAIAGQPYETVRPAVYPADEILQVVRYMGYNPSSPALRRGAYYVLHAFDPRGVEMRIVADAELGDILLIEPAFVLNQIYPPSYFSGPLIIHVPEKNGRSNNQNKRG